MHATVHTIIIETYNPAWATQFSQLAAVFRSAIGERLIRAEHVGSTSVDGLAAKPIIDIDLVIDRRKSLPEVIDDLSTLGYTHLGDLDIPGREAFRRPDHADIPHNLYVCDINSDELARHVRFRDYLREHPRAVERYGALKRDLAAKYPNDIDAYCSAKTDFICAILNEVTPQLAEDARQNNAPRSSADSSSS